MRFLRNPAAYEELEMQRSSLDAMFSNRTYASAALLGSVMNKRNG